MTTLVIDVPAEHSGAMTILNEFLFEFSKEKDNNYIVVLSTPKYQNTENVVFLNFEWVKKSHLHRLYFDRIIVPKLIKQYKPDKVLSLQNNAFRTGKIYQEVYFQNALPISEKKFGFSESRSLWVYQNIIGGIVRRSLKYANKIIVQADWIKKALEEKWNLQEDRIVVKRPNVLMNGSTTDYHPEALFYPANGSLYKNHITLLKALLPLWEKYDGPELRLTGTKENLPLICRETLGEKNYPIKFLGRLTKEGMIEQYQSTILVFPSYIETVGLPLLEAKCVGSSIIAADCAYAKEALDNYKESAFFSPFDVETLMELIKEVCTEREILS